MKANRARTSWTFEELVVAARDLSAVDRQRLLLALTRPETAQPKRSLYGLWADRGPAPTAEEIDRSRAESWADFPRTDI